MQRLPLDMFKIEWTAIPLLPPGYFPPPGKESSLLKSGVAEMTRRGVGTNSPGWQRPQVKLRVADPHWGPRPSW